MEFSSKYWWLAVVRGVILIALAIFTFRHPLNALFALGIYIGISILISGFVESGGALAGRDVLPNWGWLLVGGILDIVFGIIFLQNPIITAATIPFVVGIWLMIRGVIVFVTSLSLKKAGDSGWGWLMVGGIITVVLGYFIGFNIFFGVATVTSWMGIAFLFFGILNVSEGFSLRPKK